MTIIEALPEATVRLLADVGLAPALAAAGAATVHGFDNAYGPGRTRTLDGVWTHVDRVQLARECLRADVAPVYTGPGRTGARPGRVARVRDGWAYRLEHPQATTVGVVRHHSAGAAALDSVLAGELDADDPEWFVRAGICPAAVQWSRQPVGPGRLAVGDAALALSPLAGQGLRFAVSSALAATAVLRSWRDGPSQLASDYYRWRAAAILPSSPSSQAGVRSGRRRSMSRTGIRSTPTAGCSG